MFNTKKFIISSTITLGAVSLVYAGIIGSIHADQIRNADKTVVVSDEEFHEIVIQHQVTKAPTPYPDFDLIHLSNVRVLKEENENDESRVTGTGESSIDSAETGGIESDNDSDSGIPDESVSCGIDIGQDYSEESVPELVESESVSETELEGHLGEYSGDAETGYSDGFTDESEMGLTYLGDWIITAYCSCEICCGSYSSGYTASGTLATAGRTISCNSLPIGTQVMIDGNVYTVEDTGWSPYGENWIDIFFDSHDEALAFGMQMKEVYLVG